MVLCPTMLEILWNFPLRFIVIHPVCVNHACGGIRAMLKGTCVIMRVCQCH